MIGRARLLIGLIGGLWLDSGAQADEPWKCVNAKGEVQYVSNPSTLSADPGWQCNQGTLPGIGKYSTAGVVALAPEQEKEGGAAKPSGGGGSWLRRLFGFEKPETLPVDPKKVTPSKGLFN